MGIQELFPFVHGLGGHAAATRTGLAPPARWMHDTSFGGWDSAHIMGGGRQPPRVYSAPLFSGEEGQQCVPLWVWTGCAALPCLYRLGRHHQCTLASPAKACCSSRLVRAGLATLAAPALVGEAVIFVQHYFIVFFGFFLIR